MTYNPTHVFFDPGHRCQLRDVTNAPVMWVESVDRAEPEAGEKRGRLLGITCRWFSLDGTLQRARFSTKDLRKLTGEALRAALAATTLPQQAQPA